MCRAKIEGGRRCAGCLTKRRTYLTSKIEELKFNGEATPENPEYTKLSVALDETVEALNATDTGYKELGDAVRSATDPVERQRLLTSYKAATLLRAKRAKEDRTAALSREQFSAKMDSLGVSREEQAHLIAMMSNYERNSQPKSENFYEGQFEKAKADFAATRTAHIKALEAIAQSKMTHEQKDAAVENEKERFKKARAAAGQKLKKSRRLFDLSERGQALLRMETGDTLKTLMDLVGAQEDHGRAIQYRRQWVKKSEEAMATAKKAGKGATNAMLAQIQGYRVKVNEAEEAERQARAKYAEALDKAQRLKIPGEVKKDYDNPEKMAKEYSAFQHERIYRAENQRAKMKKDRNLFDHFTKAVKRTVKDHGGTDADAKEALWSFRRPKDKRVGEAKTEPVFIHLTPEEYANLQAARKARKGKASFKDDLMSSPIKRSQGTTPDEGVVIASNGMPGRNRTVAEGPMRDHKVKVKLTPGEKEALRLRALMYHSTVSSYGREMLLKGGNPLKWQNDRSEEHRAEKMRDFENILRDSD